MVRLTVLGTSAAWPEAGRACTGFLVEHDEFRIAIDLGNGTLSRLLTVLGSNVAAGLDALVVTHSHPDHMVDAHALMRARLYGQQGLPKVKLYAPEPVRTRLSSLEEDDAAAVTEAFEYWQLPSEQVDVGPFRLSSRRLPHYVENVAVRLDSGGVSVAYSGDTGPDPGIAEVGRGVDLFILDATDRHQQKGQPREQGHELVLTSEQAGQAAAEAGCRRLMLTHFWPGNDRELARRQAARHFNGEILVAEEGMVVEL